MVLKMELGHKWSKSKINARNLHSLARMKWKGFNDQTHNHILVTR